MSSQETWAEFLFFNRIPAAFTVGASASVATAILLPKESVTRDLVNAAAGFLITYFGALWGIYGSDLKSWQWKLTQDLKSITVPDWVSKNKAFVVALGSLMMPFLQAEANPAFTWDLLDPLDFSKDVLGNMVALYILITVVQAHFSPTGILHQIVDIDLAALWAWIFCDALNWKIACSFYSDVITPIFELISGLLTWLSKLGDLPKGLKTGLCVLFPPLCIF